LGIKNKIVSEDAVRQFIKLQGIPILEKDITDLLSELSYNKTFYDVDKYFRDTVLSMKGNGKSKYFESLDKLYPGNKFREIMNYYLFSEDCYSFVFIGYGQTGKTTFVSLISKILGEDFFGRANVALLKNGHGTAILEGKNLFEVAEAQDLDLDTANMLKSMITNDDIYINPKFQLPRKIKPHIKMIMTCNNMPRFKVTDDGIIRRFIIVKMDNKITQQNKNFIKEMEVDIPNIINEALEHPFNIEDFAREQYYIFENDPQYGFGYGPRNLRFGGEDEYDKYKTMCKALGYNNRNEANYKKFIELAKIYHGRIKCDTISEDSQDENGMLQLELLEDVELPF
jgi:Predicted ATPase